MKEYLKEMRVHHYIKNLLVFIPLVCNGHILDSDKLLPSVYAFFSFCFLSSAIYFINDIRDVEKDRNHPTKCNRPIAAGKIPIRSAIICAVALILLAILFNSLCFNPFATVLLMLYFLLNLGYSFGLKNVPLLDITILAAGFLIRAVYGSVVTGIEMSDWLYLVILSAAFYFGLGKRRNELKKQGNNTRDVIRKYPISFLESNMYVCMALVFVFYALWTMDAKTVEAYHGSRLIWTVPMVMLIFMKYSMTVEGNSDGDPVEVLIHDRVLLGLCAIYLLLMLALLYIIR
jgi:4-hydroxybenzoate polyprenyltransferase